MHFLQFGADQRCHFRQRHIRVDYSALSIAVPTVFMTAGTILFRSPHFRAIYRHAATLAKNIFSHDLENLVYAKGNHLPGRLLVTQVMPDGNSRQKSQWNGN